MAKAKWFDQMQPNYPYKTEVKKEYSHVEIEKGDTMKFF